MTENQTDYFVSVSFRLLSRYRKELGNAIYLFLGLSDLTTKEGSYHGVRFGAVLGFSILTDQRLADRLGEGYTTTQVRWMRRKLKKLGLIIQHDVPLLHGYQLAVVGSNKGREQVDLPTWVVSAASKMPLDNLPTTKTVARGGQDLTGAPTKTDRFICDYKEDNTENIPREDRKTEALFWEGKKILRLTYAQLGVLLAYGWSKDEVFNVCNQTEADGGEPVRNPVGYIDACLHKSFGDPVARNDPMPLAEMPFDPAILRLPATGRGA